MVPSETYRHKMFKGVLRPLVIINKAIFVKAIIAYARFLESRGLVPTRENTFLPNIHKMLDWRDEFLERASISSRIELIEALFTIGISEYAHDTVYQFFIDWLLWTAGRTDWVCPAKWINPYWKLIGANGVN